jgi:hypothetical protein
MQQRIMIVSAELSTLSSSENSIRTDLFADMIAGLNIEAYEATGFYKGTQENSFICIINNNEDQNVVAQIALNNFDQESVLIQDSNGQAYLEFQDSKTLELGRLTQVDKSVAIESDCYTEINNKYYLAA